MFRYGVWNAKQQDCDKVHTMKKTAVMAMLAAMAVSAFAEPYSRLFKIYNPQGVCEIRPKGLEAFEKVQRDKAYPFGSTVRCGKESSVVLLFSAADAVRLMADSSADVLLDETGGKETRVVSMIGGTALTRINATTTNDFVVVDTPVCRVSSIIGNCKVVLTRSPAVKTDPATVEVELRAEPSSKMKVTGDQFIIPVLKNGFGARILSYADNSYSYITDLLGDYVIYVNTGLDKNPPEPFEENSNLSPIKVSTKSALRVWREKAPASDTLVVAVLATTPAGKGRESFAFAVGKADIAARSNVFLDTITNELAMAELARVSQGEGGDELSDGLGDGLDEFDTGADGGLGGDEPAAESGGEESSGDDALYDFLF